ncbi:MAG: tetratricopeptide repeat protein [Formivibrio sp.]|nr:tetratricopeptide repeat protein [Formivibrio sp.]
MNLLHALKKTDGQMQLVEVPPRMPDTLLFPTQAYPNSQQESTLHTTMAHPIPTGDLAAHEEKSGLLSDSPFGEAIKVEKQDQVSNPRKDSHSIAQAAAPTLPISRAKSPRHLLRTWIPAGAIILGGIGAGFWWQQQPFFAEPTTTRAVETAERPVSTAATTIQKENENRDQAASTQSSAPVAQISIPLPPATTSLTEQISRPPADDKARYIEAQPSSENSPKIERNIDEAPIPAPLQNAWQAWQRGDLIGAEKQYRRMLASDANNRDALLGLAAIAARQGQTTQSMQWYQRLLALNPQDQEAQTGLLLLNPKALSAATEMQLLQNNDRNRSPLLLGQYYAANNRWHEAQEQFFQAFVHDQDNADLAFNLAVSLDHIGQGKLSADYYHRALSLGNGHFERAVAEQRITALMSAQQ